MTTGQDDEFVPSVAEPSGEFNNDSPLLDFWANGAGWQLRSGTSRKGNPWQRVNFKFVDGEVLESTEPFIFPVFEVSMFYSDPGRTPKRVEGQGTNEWEILAESIRRFFPESTNPLNDLMGGRWRQPGDEENCQGVRQHWKRVPSLVRVGPDEEVDDWHDVTRPCWHVVEIEGMAGTAGAGGTDIYTYLVNMADGKTETEFKRAALGDQQILTKPEMVEKFTKDTMIQELVDLGKVSRDGDKLVKVG